MASDLTLTVNVKVNFDMNNTKFVISEMSKQCNNCDYYAPTCFIRGYAWLGHERQNFELPVTPEQYDKLKVGDVIELQVFKQVTKMEKI